MCIRVLGTSVGRTVAARLAGVVDLRDLSTARGTELVAPIWLSLMGALGIPASSFGFRMVR